MMKKTDTHEYFASCPKYLEQLLANELTHLNCEHVRQTVAGVYFHAEQSQMFKVCLWSRLANRILMPLARTPAKTGDEIYRAVKDLTWEEFFPDNCRFVVDFNGTSDEIRNTQFGAQRVKDAIVDRYADLGFARPQVDKAQADLRVNVRLAKANVVVSLDMSGDSLHRRGYREKQGAAPLKENLAAAILIRAGWLDMLKQARENNNGLTLIDPMCGSGTVLIEAALMAGNIAPGMLRKNFGFEQLKHHNAEIWQAIKTEAGRQAQSSDDAFFPHIVGYDIDDKVLQHARSNLRSAKLVHRISLEHRPLRDLSKTDATSTPQGLLICNPPYGERLGEVEALREDYRDLGRIAKENFSGWTLGVFTSNPKLGKEMRLRSKNKYHLLNGTIPAELLLFDLLGKQVRLREDRELSEAPMSQGAQMVANRLKKNRRRLDKWIRRENIDCFRLYDADLPEYAAAIDVYGDCYHVQEYQAPRSIDEGKASRRFKDIIHATVHAFGTTPDKVKAKTRARQKGKTQYQKLGDSPRAKFQRVKEGAATFNVNLSDYLDTGLFLDHRPLRRIIYQNVRNKSFLNLFCYTASATVQAALGGAAESLSVDLSNTYLDWAEENFYLNRINLDRHQLVRADCVEWLKSCRRGFDIIMLDPPTFSNSKNTHTVLDIQKDHGPMIARCMELLNPKGVLYFSTNLRSFKLDPGLEKRFDVQDITEQTLDLDFERNKKIHCCWEIR